MSKEFKSAVLEYFGSISDEVLNRLTQQLSDRYPGDLGEALDELSKDKKIDTFLASAKTATELFDFCDQMRDLFQKEHKKRGLAAKAAN